jgi:hypothetical protein
MQQLSSMCGVLRKEMRKSAMEIGRMRKAIAKKGEKGAHEGGKQGGFINEQVGKRKKEQEGMRGGQHCRGHWAWGGGLMDGTQEDGR